MINKLEDSQRKLTIALTVVIATIYYLPWAFDSLRIVRIHDTLDGEVVVNFIIGEIYRGNINADALALNGELPFWTFSRLMQPLSLLYALGDPWISYALTDLVVRAFAFIGIYLLAQYNGVKSTTGALIGLTFASSISFSVFLLSVAGIPFLVWLLLVSTKFEGAKFLLLLVSALFIGANISFALSGIFFVLLMLPIAILGYKQKITSKFLFCILFFLFGLILGNANLFYAQFFSGITWHRAEYETLRESGGVEVWKELLGLMKSSVFGNPWYHVTHSLLISIFTVIGFFALKKDCRKTNATFLLILLIFFIAIYVYSRSSLSDPLRDSISIFRTFQWDRFYFLYSAIVFMVLIQVFKAVESNKRLSSVLFTLTILQLGFNYLQTPHLKELARLAIGKAPAETFNGYYMREEFSTLKESVGKGPVLSVGLDPMVAPMNRIAAIDGYYVLYPLAYKKAFREIIKDSMVAIDKVDYYDRWGNRLYAFYPKGNANLINFCAAHNLGAKHVISSEEIKVPELGSLNIFDPKVALHVYKIKSDVCSSKSGNTPSK